MGSANSARIIVIKVDCLDFHSEKKQKTQPKEILHCGFKWVFMFFNPKHQDGKIEKISCANPQPYGPIEVGFSSCWITMFNLKLIKNRILENHKSKMKPLKPLLNEMRTLRFTRGWCSASIPLDFGISANCSCYLDFLTFTEKPFEAREEHNILCS